MTRPAPTVVCLDLGGVVVRICRSWPEACERAGLPVRDRERLMAPELVARRRAIAAEYEVGRLGTLERHQRMADATLGLYDVDEVIAVHDAWTLEEYPGVHELVCEIGEREDVTTACLSNTNHAHWVRLIDSVGSGEYRTPGRLAKRFASHELGLAKPDTEIYAVATRALGVPPSHVLFFDDLLENVLAARAAGWRAEQIDPEGEPAAQMRAALARHGVL